MSDAELRIAGRALHAVLSDEPWEDLGIGKRPKVGRFFQRFRPTWRVELEDRIAQEMLAMFSAAFLLAEDISAKSAASLAAIYTSTPDASTAFGFATQSAGATHLTALIESYMKLSIGGWPAVLAQRLGITSLPDTDLRARLMVGIIKLCSNVDSMMHGMKGGKAD
jgi:hypothetical protein